MRTTGPPARARATSTGTPSAAQSAASNGYLRLAGGFLFQWGSGSTTLGSGSITYPIPFPNSVYAVMATITGGAATGSLNDRTLVVSGASRGIGLAIALEAARHGANVVLLAKTAEPHPKLKGTVFTAAEEIEAAGGKAAAVIA